MSIEKEWKEGVIDVEKLELDLQNPRIPKYIRGQKDINQIRNYLLDKRGVLRIASNIAKNGYHHSVVPIVCEENGRIIVLEGNRRLAACQLLLKPDLATKDYYRKEFEELSKHVDEQKLKEVRVMIAPSRKGARKEILDLHVNPLQKTWQALEELRMYKDLIDSGEHTIDSACFEYGAAPSEFKKELGRLFFYEKILEQIGIDKEELLESNFRKIDHLILSKNGKKLLDYWIDDKGDAKFTNESEANEKLEKLIPYIIDSQEVSTRATQDWIVKHIFLKIDPDFSTDEGSLIEQNELGLDEPILQGRTPRGKNKLLELFGGNLALKNGTTNDIYMDISDLYEYYSKNEEDLSPTFPALIRMSLRLLVESAASEGETIKDYLKANFEKAKKQLDQDQKTTLINNSIEGPKKLEQLLQSGAHEYTSSANIWQTVAMSIIIGEILKITHPKEQETELTGLSFSNDVRGEQKLP